MPCSPRSINSRRAHVKALETAEEAVKNEKSLSRYREEQNLGELDLNLSGFVCLTFSTDQCLRTLLSRRSSSIARTCVPNVA